MELYRPVGVAEAMLVLESGCRAFPPRLELQPIFYPVLNLGYAQKIARDWNTKDEASGYGGFVTRFEVAEEFIAKYEVQTVGSSAEQEYWIPAEDLADFNASIRVPIRFIEAYYGDSYIGPSGIANFKNRNWREQFQTLNVQHSKYMMDFHFDLAVNWNVVVLNFPLWTTSDFEGINDERKGEIIAGIRIVEKFVERIPPIEPALGT